MIKSTNVIVVFWYIFIWGWITVGGISWTMYVSEEAFNVQPTDSTRILFYFLGLGAYLSAVLVILKVSSAARLRIVK